MNDEEALRQAQAQQEIYQAQQMNDAKKAQIAMQKARQTANNSNAVMAAANIAEASGEPHAAAIGKGIKIADKVTGGKSTEMLGKAVTGLTKASGLKGKMAQKAINKLSESGTADRISKAVAAKNSSPKSGSVSGTAVPKGDSNPKNKGNSLLDSSSKRKTEESTGGEGLGNFSGDLKVVKYGLIVTAMFMPIAVLVVLFMSASRIYQVSIGLGHSDNLTDKVEEDKINKGIKEKDLNDDSASVDMLDEARLKFRNNKLNELNLVQVATTKNRYLRRKYNEATLSEIRDFYPAVTELGKNYDENLVYDFFAKMYNLYTYYNENYPVDANDKQPILNLPLLMSTLMLQSDDMNVVFAANLEDEDRSSEMRETPATYSYDYNWTGTVLSKNSSVHDMEILAQHMVSKMVKETCSDSAGKVVKTNILRDNEIGTQVLTCDEGYTYSKSEEHYGFDDAKYKEFLKEFIEKKYFEEGVPLGSSNQSSIETPSFTKYTFSDDEINALASFLYHKVQSPVGVASFASLVANKFEISPIAQSYKDSYGETGTAIYHYVRESNTWENAEADMDKNDAPSDVIDVVKKVLVDGMRTLPGYVDEYYCYDCSTDKCSSGIKGNICKLDNGSKKLINMSEIKDHSNYERDVTKIYNPSNNYYTFYSFPASISFPFGYTSESLKESMSECHYNSETWETEGCGVISSGAGNEYAQAMLSLANTEYENGQGYSDGLKYTNAMGYAAGTPWCAIFVSWLSQNTTVNGKSIYPDFVNFQSAGVYQFMHYFYYDAKEENKDNIKFYYNDSCSKMSGKNGSTSKYTPKPGDYIFFDWEESFSDISDLQYDYQDHIGIVEKYENGQVYTIEGNVSDDLKKRSFDMTDCQVIGFGSWY